jgi:pimeloyl-ACP methyl ester carboxylesterase
MSRTSLLVIVGAAVVVAGCGSGSEPQGGVVERSVGHGARQVWLFEPKEQEPKALVVFIHGRGDATEDTPANHRPWLRHLAERGNAVLYPRYEAIPGDARALRFLFDAVPPAAGGLPKGLPVVLIGYSRGGGLAVDYTALHPQIGLPRAVLAVFPILLDPKLDLRSIPPRVRFLFLVGDRDTQVGASGAADLVRQLAAAGYPRRLMRGELVRSHGGFQATHLSVLESGPGARRAFWAPADRLIESVTSAGGAQPPSAMRETVPDAEFATQTLPAATVRPRGF